MEFLKEKWPQQAMEQQFGLQRYEFIKKRYENAFNSNYLDQNSVQQWISDIENLEKLINQGSDTICDFGDFTKNRGLQIRLYQKGSPVTLSDVLPILESMNFRIHREELWGIHPLDHEEIMICNLTASYSDNEIKSWLHVRRLCEETFTGCISGKTECDGFNRLITIAGVSSQEIQVIRAYVKYLGQVRFRFSRLYVEQVLCRYAEAGKLLIDLFCAMHDPDHEDTRKAKMADAQAALMNLLGTIKDINEDTILRRLMKLIQATVRTNYFKKNSQNFDRNYVTLKIDVRSIPEIPRPVPVIDTFVYSKDFEGIHLRSHKISRGGIRWSERHEDYRNEVLGLMKAQKVKNSVIVPSGAKGGFIIKPENEHLSAANRQEKVLKCYKNFIRGLLDVTDNIIQGKTVHPERVVCHDEDDTYLVVAADKGTAKFSDIANQVAAEYQFWLGDAFASGGSRGYDHKKLGITAKGAWESVKRYFFEIPELKDRPITVIGIGDMSGDVFGNGMIYSDNIKLVAAFDHRHIFIDPDPDPVISWHERKRLFDLAGSDWTQYDRSALSPGGGIFSRSERSIALSAEARKLLETSQDELTPDELITAVLKAPVDLLYNGGIGTYIKSSDESNEQVGDKLNEYCRINGSELRCRMVCEGGNLGLTQPARIEYALSGGLINTDFIDNSAGVDCSDHEVNLKILLDEMVAGKTLNEQQRNEILESVEREIKDLVLQDNYLQSLVLSFSSQHSRQYMDLYRDHIKKLVECAGLDRKVEYLPDDSQLRERKASGKGLTRPELAVLLSYTKIHVRESIQKSDLHKNCFFDDMALSAFPESISRAYANNIKKHYLRSEIISTQLSNSMINMMGITFPFRLQSETGASIAEIASAYRVASLIYDANGICKLIQSIDGNIFPDKQYEMLHYVRQLISMATRWFLRENRLEGNLGEIVCRYRESIRLLGRLIPDLVVGQTREYQSVIAKELVASGLPEAVAREISVLRVMYTALNISEVSYIHKFDLERTARVYFQIGGQFNLVWLRDALVKDIKPDRRSNLARMTIRDDIDTIQRRIAVLILQSGSQNQDAHSLVEQWIYDHNPSFANWRERLRMLQESEHDDYAMYFIALRELSDITMMITHIEKLSYQALHDSLTGLPNRIMLSEKINFYINHAENRKNKFLFNFIDLNHFKKINDLYGHQVGDRVLKAVALRLNKAVLQHAGFASRIGGDEFVVIFHDIQSRNEISKYIDTIQDQFRKPLIIDETELKVSVSIGHVLYPDDGRNADELLNLSDKRMYSCKHSEREPKPVDV